MKLDADPLPERLTRRDVGFVKARTKNLEDPAQVWVLNDVESLQTCQRTASYAWCVRT
jgi:hypothetical protein